jgi:hypothetical protein
MYKDKCNSCSFAWLAKCCVQLGARTLSKRNPDTGTQSQVWRDGPTSAGRTSAYACYQMSGAMEPVHAWFCACRLAADCGRCPCHPGSSIGDGRSSAHPRASLPSHHGAVSHSMQSLARSYFRTRMNPASFKRLQTGNFSQRGRHSSSQSQRNSVITSSELIGLSRSS